MGENETKEEFDVIKWRKENPMDYIMAMNLINQASNKNEVFWTIYNITRLHIPDLLYKYCSLGDNASANDAKFQTLQNQKIFMSDVKSLNDPFDSKAYFYRPEVLAKYDRLKHCNGRLIDDFSAYIRVASFTSNGVSSMPMWAHYANNHKGYCIEYDMKDLKNTKLSASTFPVQYTNKRIDITNLMDFQVGQIIQAIETQMAQGRKGILYDDLTTIYMESFFCNIKHDTWSYEHEFRCTVGATISGMPYFDAKPKAIYIGAKCSDSHVKMLVSIAERLNISAYRMTYDEYSLDFNLIPKLIRNSQEAT